MMTKYYYLLASLPYLSRAASPLLSIEDFMAECNKWLMPEDMDILLSVGSDGDNVWVADTELVREWKEFDLGLRKELAEFRLSRKAGESGKVGEQNRGITEGADPLLMEKRFEKTRWDFLDDKWARYYFDVNALVIYFLKLKILTRLAGFDKDKGENIFYKLCEVTYG